MRHHTIIYADDQYAPCEWIWNDYVDVLLNILQSIFEKKKKKTSQSLITKCSQCAFIQKLMQYDLTAKRFKCNMRKILLNSWHFTIVVQFYSHFSIINFSTPSLHTAYMPSNLYNRLENVQQTISHPITNLIRPLKVKTKWKV